MAPAQHTGPQHPGPQYPGRQCGEPRPAPAAGPPGGGWPEGTLLAELRRDGSPAALAAERAVLRLGTRRAHGHGETLILDRDLGGFVLLLLTGFAKATVEDTGGAPALLDIRAYGDVVGEAAALDDRPRSATVTAAGPVTLRRISQADWLHWLGGHAAAGLALSRCLVHRGRVTTRRLVGLVSEPVVHRLAHHLADLAGRYGTAGPRGAGLTVRPRLTQAELAALVGAGERRVHHALHELAGHGLIRLGRRRTTVLSLPGLLAVAAGAEPGTGPDGPERDPDGPGADRPRRGLSGPGARPPAARP
ncbi:Crp/Fnr family transcriptional regulator [Kitasatospora sp. NPDC094019]|uniref:Crp/Fnr family transcriptional regulator n=1 Tax=Kitasatospora sp. NPDC094019 TaxID=3364091 RepID=UPI00381719DF